jgi:hypothetical protein
MVAPLRLPEHWSQFFSRQPETGMDYQIVDLTLRDGRIIRDVAIVGSSLIGEARGQPDVRFDPADITHIEVTHNKSDFHSQS